MTPPPTISNLLDDASTLFSSSVPTAGQKVAVTSRKRRRELEDIVFHSYRFPLRLD
jgi:hypothetical protein